MTTGTAHRSLTADQVLFFHTFGYIRIREAFPPNEMLAFVSECLDIFRRDRRDRIFDGTWRQQVDAFIEHSDLLSPLATDPRILLPIQQLLGDGCIWIGSDGNLYTGDTGWHPDGSNLAYRRIKVLTYLNPLSIDSGALRIIAGSHRDPLHSELRPLLQRLDTAITPYGVIAPRRDQVDRQPFGIPMQQLPYVCVDVRPGDIVLFDQNIWHSSYGGCPGRMMFTVNYGESPVMPEQVEFVRQMYAGQLQFCMNVQITPYSCLFPDTFIQANRSDIYNLLRVASQLGYVGESIA